MEGNINKKEYLKKYLSGDKKKKKRKVTSSLPKSKIIDDDLDIRKIRPIDDNELEIYDLAEDAPQIVGIIDDGPEEVRITSEYRETKKWKIITKEYEDVHVSAIRNKDSDFSGGAATNSKRSDNSIDRGKSHQQIDKKKARNYDSDASPPRKTARKKGEADDSDASPPRLVKHADRKKSKSNQDSDSSLPRRKKKSEIDSDSDASPPRKIKRGSDSDASPPRRERPGQANSKQRAHNKKRDDSGDERHRKSHSFHKSRTLEGKKAGLQDASELRKEVAEIRRRQEESLALLGKEGHGKGAAAIHRDKKTGRKRDLKEEARLKKEKDEKNAELIAQYSVWGKGVKQMDDKAVKLKEDLYEMSKPVARYVDDIDLEEMRKNEEYDDDPMIDYIRNKRRKEGKISKEIPQYQGSWMPNRYNIRPGHKWDGVDRSNGYEKKWFEERNAKKAREEEALKWSTEDM